MNPEVHDIVIALRRSRVKHRVYAALVHLRRASVAELADAACTDDRRVLAVLHGDDGGYRHDTSLVSLAIATPARGAFGRAYRLTRKGSDAWEAADARVRAAAARAAQPTRT